MKKNIIWTKSEARLELFRTDNSNKYNWLFIPGGPGLGSKSLRDLTQILHLPGTMWYMDFPGDGSNITNKDFSHWQAALIEATQEQNNVILVTHSSGGMFSLATPELEKNLTGLILMDSAPNAGWQKVFTEYVTAHPIAEAEKLQKLYNENPSNELLKQLTIACAPYFSTKKSLDKIVTMMNSLPFHYKSHCWAEKNFDPVYKASWIPQTLPTLIFAGDQDHITPLKLFLESNEFQRNNILMREITNASHFPWMDNPEEVKRIFAEYCQFMRSLDVTKGTLTPTLPRKR